MPKEDPAYQAWLEENRKALEGKPVLEKFNKLLEEDTEGELTRTVFRGYERTSAFNRKMTDLDNTVKEKVEQRIAGWKDWETKVKAAHEALGQENARLKTQLAKGGKREDVDPDLDLDEGERPANRVALPANAVTVDQYNQLLDYVKSVDAGATVFAKKMMKVTRQAIKDGYEVDLDEVHKLAAVENLEPIEAYKRLTSDLREADNKKAEEARIVKEVEKRVKEAKSKQTPDDMRPAGPVLASKDYKPLSKEERRARAAETFSHLMEKEE